MRFTAVGELMLDLELRRGARAHEASIRARAGGTAANAAAWAAAAGADAACVGRIGADVAGEAIAAALRAAGVRPLLAVDPGLPTGTVALVDGEAAVDRGANRALADADLAGLDADVLLVSGYAVLAEESAVAAAALTRSTARVRALTGGSAGLLRRGRDAFLAAAGAATLVVVNEQEAALLGDTGTATCVTRGAAGATLHLGGRSYDAPGSGTAGAAHGAGDALAATLAVELGRGTDPADALAAACAAGARAAASPTGWPQRPPGS